MVPTIVCVLLLFMEMSNLTKITPKINLIYIKNPHSHHHTHLALANVIANSLRVHDPPGIALAHRRGDHLASREDTERVYAHVAQRTRVPGMTGAG